MAETWTVQKLLTWTSDFFKSKEIESPRLDAEVLLANVMNLKRLELYLRFNDVVDENRLGKFRELVKRRSQREPVSYILGEKEFYGRSFKVNRSTLIPRPETEILVDEVLLEVFPKKEAGVSIERPAIDQNLGSPTLSMAESGQGATASELSPEDEKLKALMDLHSLEDEEENEEQAGNTSQPTPSSLDEIAAKKALEIKYKEKLSSTFSKGSQLPVKKSIGLSGVKLGPKKTMAREIKVGTRARILDVGTGSGCIAITLACELEKVGTLTSVEIVALDKSKEAIEMASKNASQLVKGDFLKNISFLMGDFFEPSLVATLGTFDVIVSNPPYVGELEKPSLSPEVLKYEPEAALFGGTEGHELIEKWADHFYRCLVPGGFLFLEIGSAQADKITNIFEKHGGYEGIKIIKDLSGHQRVFRIRKAHHG